MSIIVDALKDDDAKELVVMVCPDDFKGDCGEDVDMASGKCACIRTFEGTLAGEIDASDGPLMQLFCVASTFFERREVECAALKMLATGTFERARWQVLHRCVARYL